MSFQDLKRNSASNFDKLNKELSKLNSNQFSDPLDDKLWKLSVDKAGNGSAIIRFLPAPEGEDIPFVRIWDHGFKGPTGQWYIEKSLTTIGQDDPVGERNSKLWNTGLDSDKEKARETKRRLKYYANIYVVNDPANPENNGTVKLFAFGKKIFDKLNDLMNPQFEDEKAIDPFNLWEGANFRLKQRKVDGWPNYDKSDFDSQGPLLDDDDKLEEIYKSEFSLKELVDPKNFKTYDELKKRFEKVMGFESTPVTQEQKTQLAKERADPPKLKETTAKTDVAEDDEDMDDFFKRIGATDLDDDLPF